MFCSKCGNELQEGQAFCPKCGVKVADGSKSVVHQQSPFGEADVPVVSSSSTALDRLVIIPLVLAMVSYAFPFMASPLRSVSAFEIFTDSFLMLPFLIVLLSTIFACVNVKTATMICSFLALTIYGIISALEKSEQNAFWNFGAGFYVFITAMIVAIGLSIWRGLGKKEET